MSVSDYVDVIALIVASVALIMSVIFSYLQQKHNKNSVRPIASIIFSDYEDYIEVKIKNSGTGPMVIKNVKVTRDLEEAGDLLSLMPQINQLWKNYTIIFKDQVLAPNDELSMLAIVPNDDTVKEKVRIALSPVKIFIEYEDIYGSEFSTQRDCSFFGRLLQGNVIGGE